MPKQTTPGQSALEVNEGAYAQGYLTAAMIGLNPVVPASGNSLSGVYQSDGFGNIAVGIKSPAIGVLTLQRYIDDAGTIPQGAAITANLLANTFAALNSNDGAAFSSFTINVSNSSGAPVTLTNFGLLMQAK